MARPPWLFPPALGPGATVRVVAPSGPFDRTLFLRGLGCLGKQYRIRFDWRACAPHGFLAGPDERRLRELQEALDDPEVSAVIAARGGTGLGRLLPALNLAGLRRHPKWVVGFSDVTALHLELSGAGIASLHAPNVTGLGRGDAAQRARLLEQLATPCRPRRYRVERWRPGNARGPLVGGNLTVLHACAAAGRLTLPDGAVLLLEDVGEHAYRLDRALATLLDGGHFDRLAAVIVAELTACAPSRGMAALEVVRERFRGLPVPVAAGLGLGHGRANEPVTLLATARLHGSELWLAEP